MSVLAQEELCCQVLSIDYKGVRDNKVQCGYLQKEYLPAFSQMNPTPDTWLSSHQHSST